MKHFPGAKFAGLVSPKNLSGFLTERKKGGKIIKIVKLFDERFARLFRKNPRRGVRLDDQINDDLS